MTTALKKRLDRIIDYLQKKYSAKAIILVGSRIVGDYDAHSDWDMFVFTNKLKKGEPRIKVIERCGFPAIKGETKLDCTWIPVHTSFSSETFGLKLRYSQVVLDTKSKTATKVRKKALQVYKKGPQWSPAKALLEKNRSLGYIQRMDILLKQGKEGELFKRICWYYAEYLFDWWFALRGMWPLRPQQAFAYIKQKDKLFYNQLKKIYAGKTLKDKVAGCKAVHKLLFESNKFKRLIK